MFVYFLATFLSKSCFCLLIQSNHEVCLLLAFVGFATYFDDCFDSKGETETEAGAGGADCRSGHARAADCHLSAVEEGQTGQGYRHFGLIFQVFIRL